MGRWQLIQEDKDEEDSGPTLQAKPLGGGPKYAEDADSGIFNSSEGDLGLAEGDHPLYQKP